jgi:FkbM family methyltransferase
MRTRLKFRGRVLLTQLGLWRTLERCRLGWRFRAGQPHEPDFRFFHHFDGSSALFVDIGANIGQSALSFRLFNRTSPIVSFEANADLEPELRYVQHLLGDGFTYRLHGLGAETREVTLFVPVVAGVPLTQEASLFREALESDTYRDYLAIVIGRRDMTLRQRPLRLRRFDDLGLRPGFVKIDVERAEQAILEGMTRTLDECRPLLLVEGQHQVRDLLAARGYRLAVYDAARDALVPYRPWAAHHYNFFFVPEEMTAALAQRGIWHGP